MCSFTPFFPAFPFLGWLYGSTMATESQRMRGYCVKTQRACAPNDYIFENMTVNKFLRCVAEQPSICACAATVSRHEGLIPRTTAFLST